MTDQTDRHKAALTDRYVIVRELEALPPTPGRAGKLGQIYAALGNREEALRWFEYEPDGFAKPWAACFNVRAGVKPL